MANNRAKFGYLNYSDMLTKISDGILDIHDIVFTKDSHETYIVSPDSTPIPMRAKVYVFDSVTEANTQLNANTDTYVGQIVSIANNDVYNGYIVNQDTSGTYSVKPLSTDVGNLDYNTLGNRPIENLVGTLDEPIVIENLTTGIYKVKGQYKIVGNEETIYLSADGDLFLIEVSDTEKYIKRFTKDSIYDFVVSNEGIVKKTYITDEYLESNGYTTTDYIDGKITALEESIKEYIVDYIEELVETSLDTIIDEKIDIKLDEKIQATTNEEVQNLFK